jgi:hypothetical protein
MRVLGFLLASFSATTALAGESACVLPTADGGDVDWSPPSITGVITKAGADKVTVRTPDGKFHLVHVSHSTRLSTVYGGGFDPGQLMAGQHALVWLNDCSEPGTINRAGVLQVCSLAAEPCPG